MSEGEGRHGRESGAADGGAGCVEGIRRCGCSKLARVVRSMLAWWGGTSVQQRSHERSVSFKKYVDFIMYDKECFIAPPVSSF
ncbi:hypothetical protein ACOMHN_018280 [Nucella lapillus]